GAIVPGISSNAVVSALAALSAIWILTLINIMGMRSAGIVQLVTTILKIVPLVLIIIIGILYFEPQNLKPFNATGESAFKIITATAALTLWAFLGIECATIPAESIDEPAKTIPRATLTGTLLTAVIYFGATLGIMGVLAPGELAQSSAPFADAANQVWGSKMQLVIAVGATIAVFGALNGWIMMMGQCAMVAARDAVFPAIFARQSRWGTPALGLVFGSALSSVLLLLNYTRRLIELFTFVILLATVSVLVPYVFAALADFRRSLSTQRIHWSRSVVSLAAFAFSIWAIAGAGQDVVYWGFILLLAGLPVYVFMHSRKVSSGIRVDV
ncbi:MAG: amino acid permease, partial [Gammaproteobacteria bacterium]